MSRTGCIGCNRNSTTFVGRTANKKPDLDIKEWDLLSFRVQQQTRKPKMSHSFMSEAGF